MARDVVLYLSKVLNPLVIYASDCGPGVVLILCELCGFYYGVFHVESCIALCSRAFSVFLAL